ncbi:MAG: SIMPL domain-containing protein [Bacteriovorax sp.]|nr:SIMPL domain-containing protein [Bacteriovorax sp.]
MHRKKGDLGKTAQSNFATENEIIKRSIETYKIKKEDVKTTSYNFNPDYNYYQRVIILRNIQDAGAFIDSLTSSLKSKNSGINVNSFKFDLEKRDEEQSALSGDAVRAAEAQAEVLAKAAKVKLPLMCLLSILLNKRRFLRSKFSKQFSTFSDCC